MRTMAFRPDAKNPALRDAYCCQRVPFVVGFHPDGSLTSYSEMLPGVSEIRPRHTLAIRCAWQVKWNCAPTTST